MSGTLLDKTAIQADAELTDSPAEHADGSGTPVDAPAEHAAAPDSDAAGCADDEQAASDDAKHTVLKRILAAHETWFDVQRDYEYAGRVFPGYAEFHEHGEKYVLVKRAKLWEIDAHEYIFFVLSDLLTASDLDELIAFMKTDALAKVHPEPDHMTSYLSLVVVADDIEQGLDRKVRRTSYRKDFMLGLRGWADLRVAVVDLASQRVYTNSQGSKMAKSLAANIDPKEEK